MSLSARTIDEYIVPNSFRDGFTIYVDLYRIRSRGNVSLRSKDPRENLAVDYQMFSDERDLRTLVEGCKLADKLATSASVREELDATPFKNTLPGCTKYPYGTDEFFACLARTITTDGLHPCCTCKMASTSDPMAVVDPSLQVIGVKNLRIIDSSIMPEIVNANLNAPTIMLAEKGADIIKLKYGNL